MNFLEFVLAAARWVVDASLSASVLIILVLALQRFCKGALSPAWRYALWIPVVLRLLLPLAPESSFSLFNLATPLRTFWTPAQEPAVRIETNLPSPNAALHQAATPNLAHAVNSPRDQAVLPREQSLLFGAALLWAIISALLVVRLFGGFLWLMRHLRQPVGPMTRGGFSFLFSRHLGESQGEGLTIGPRLEAELERIKAAFGYKGPLRLVETRLVQSPAILGLFNPVLLLPAGFRREFADIQLTHILAHEVAHLKRGDLFAAWVLAVVQALHWFNPLVWFALARCRADREMACDALVLARLDSCEPKAYGETILQLLERMPRLRGAIGTVGILESKKQIGDRLRTIANFRRETKAGWLGWTLLIASVLAGLTNPIAHTEAPGSISPKSSQPPPSLTRFLDEFQIDRIDFTGKSLDQVLRELSQKIMQSRPEFDELFILEQAGPVGDTPGIYSVRATGFVRQKPGSPHSFGKDAVLRSRELKNVSLRAALDELIAASPPKISYAVDRDQIIVRADAPIQPALVEAKAGAGQRIQKIEIRPVGSPLVSEDFIREHIASKAGQAHSPAAVDQDIRRLYSTGKFSNIRVAAEPADNGEVNLIYYVEPKAEPDSLHTRTYQLQPEFLEAVQRIVADFGAPVRATTDQTKRSIFLDNRTNLLYVRATTAELEQIERSLQAVAVKPPQVVVEIKIAEVPEQSAAEILRLIKRLPLKTPPEGQSKTTPPSPSGVLSPSQSKSLMASLQQSRGVDILAAPRVTTLSSRVARVSIEKGPSVEINPVVKPGGISIALAVKFALSQPHPNTELNANGSGTIWDGQTLVIWPERAGGQKPAFIFITPTIIDPAGNRVYSPENLPDPETLPPQE